MTAVVKKKKNKMLDWEQILIRDCKIIYSEDYGKHTRQCILEMTPTGRSWRLQTNLWTSFWIEILLGRWQRKDLSTWTIHGLLVLIVSHLPSYLYLCIQAVPRLVAEKKVICTNASDSSFHLQITHIFIHSKVSIVEVFLKVMNTTKEVDWTHFFKTLT